MEKKTYKYIVDKYTPKENVIYNTMVSFFVGGLVGVIGQFIMDLYSKYLNLPTKEASVFMIVTLIFIGCLLTGLGFFDKWMSKAKCGLIIPITGFAHSMMSAAMEYRKEGLITGIGANMFKLAGSVIVYGVVAAYVFGLIKILFVGAI